MYLFLHFRGFREQVFQFCGVLEDDDAEAEKMEKWQARRRMMTQRMSGAAPRQPVAVENARYREVCLK